MAELGKPLFRPAADLRERIAQLLMVRIGSNLPPVVVADDDESRVGELVERCPVGGLLLFNGTKSGTPEMLRRLQARSKYPLLVASDIERGVGQQVHGYTLFPHAAALARSPEGVTVFMESVAREARDVGIHITFAPVADVNTNRQNPIIAIRAFSEDPQRAAESTATYVRLAEDSGLLTTAKHFPGHGDTHQDSHDSLPSVDKSLDELRICELLPFQAAIDAGGSLVMTAHVAFPKIDSSGLPATLSAPILKNLLRDEMGFRGVVCSDSLLMAGVRDLFDREGEMALAALDAGVDLLLDVNDPLGVVDYLFSCVTNRTLAEERVHEAYDRVYRLKSKAFGADTVAILPQHPLPAGTTKEQVAEDHPKTAARAAIDVSGNCADVLPLDRDRPLVAILLKPFATAIDPPQQPLAAALRCRFRDLQYFELGPQTNDREYATARAAALAAPQLVVAMIVRPAAWHAFGLLAPQAEFVRHLTSERKALVASLGVPQALDDYPAAAVKICTFSDVPVSQEALADVLLSPHTAR
jgi:beta-glucosidase-like glycosyl hydrolase